MLARWTPAIAAGALAAYLTNMAGASDATAVWVALAVCLIAQAVARIHANRRRTTSPSAH